MQSQNYIKLGVLVQKAFDLPENFKVVFLPPDTNPNQPVLVEIPRQPASLERRPLPTAPAPEFDRVTLQLAADTESEDICWYAWSAKAHILVILPGKRVL